jgi:hypothetical protein
LEKSYVGNVDPSPKKSLFVEQASCLLLTGYNPTKKITLCGIGKMPVADRIETHPKKITFCGTGILPVNDGLEAPPTRTLLQTI